MLIVKRVVIHTTEMGLQFVDGDFRGLLAAGRYWFFDPLGKIRVDVVSQRLPWIAHPDMDVIARSGALDGRATVLDLKDDQRALVWIDQRFERVLGPGLYALWTGIRDVRVEIVTPTEVRFDHPALHRIAKSAMVEETLNVTSIDEGHAGVTFLDGRWIDTLGPGRHLFWKGMGRVKCIHVDLRESVLDVSGQEIMTADKVTLRMNTVVTFRVSDAHQSVTVVDDSRQALYRESQLALRAVVGTYDLDQLLSEKEQVAADLETMVAGRAAEFGVKVLSLGIRDVILPGEMKTLMNKVIEARKAADANLITRREETAAMRSQANTARLLDSNPTLMRLRELDLLEKLAANTNLSVVLGEKGLGERVINLL